MNTIQNQHHQTFETIKQTQDEGSEFWMAKKYAKPLKNLAAPCRKTCPHRRWG